MDKFTKLANSIMSSLYENDQNGETVVYSSGPIDGEEDTESLQKQPVNDNDAVKIAQNLSVDPNNKQPTPQSGAQAKVTNAYSGLMNNLANKLNKISQNIK